MRPTFVLRVQAEPGVDEIRSLRAWLKCGLRDFGLKCVSISEKSETYQQTQAQEVPIMPVFDHRNVEDRGTIPQGLYQFRLEILPGGAGEDGMLKLAKNLHSLMLA